VGGSLLHDNPRGVTPLRVKAVANAHLGRLDEARATVAEVLAIDPRLTLAAIRVLLASAAPEFVNLYVTGLRLAGLPEG
jgi:adenylate cyclase